MSVTRCATCAAGDSTFVRSLRINFAIALRMGGFIPTFAARNIGRKTLR